MVESLRSIRAVYLLKVVKSEDHLMGRVLQCNATEQVTKLELTEDVSGGDLGHVMSPSAQRNEATLKSCCSSHPATTKLWRRKSRLLFHPMILKICTL